MAAAWSNFARFADPNGRELPVEWPPYEPDDDVLVRFGHAEPTRRTAPPYVPRTVPPAELQARLRAHACDYMDARLESRGGLEHAPDEILWRNRAARGDAS